MVILLDNHFREVHVHCIVNVYHNGFTNIKPTSIKI